MVLHWAMGKHYTKINVKELDIFKTYFAFYYVKAMSICTGFLQIPNLNCDMLKGRLDTFWINGNVLAYIRNGFDLLHVAGHSRLKCFYELLFSGRFLACFFANIFSACCWQAIWLTANSLQKGSSVWYWINYPSQAAYSDVVSRKKWMYLTSL